MVSIVEKFRAEMLEHGVSKSDVLTLESTLGEPLVSGVMNMNMITTERSTINLSSVEEALSAYIESHYDTIKPTDIITTTDLFSIHTRYVATLSTLECLLDSIANNATEDVINEIVNSKYSYTLSNGEGVETKEVSNNFDKNSTITALLYNDSLLSSLVGNTEYNVISLSIKEFFISNDSNKYVDNKIDLDIFLLLNLTLNKEIDQYINCGGFTPQVLTGKDIVRLLKDAYILREYVTESIAGINYKFTEYFTATKSGYSLYGAEEAKRLKHLANNSRLTIKYLEIINKIILSMCKR